MANNSLLYSTEVAQEAKKAIKKHSYFLIENVYSKDFCEEIKSEMDKITSGLGVEINFGGTETRIWSAQKRINNVKQFFNDSNHFLSLVLNDNLTAGTVLAIKNNPLSNGDETHKAGRWHIDSWRPQEKIFLFLSDTTEESGPLEIIPNTNNTFFRIRKAFEHGFFFDHLNFFKKGNSRNYSSISDDKVQALFERGYKAKPIIVKAGTVLIINSSYLIHRARPCKETGRYALTAYYRTSEGYHDYDV